MHSLIYGFGNPGRQDDGLGLRLADYIEQWVQKNNVPDISTDQNYQLNIEDAEKISHYDLVIFCDASTADINQVMIEEVTADLKTEFSMHSVTPSFILGLCQKIYDRKPLTYQLHIKGYSWEFMQPITVPAEENLKEAQIVLTKFILKKNTPEKI